MQARDLIVLAHRYLGLALAVVLVLVGATGGLLAFNREIDHALNPALTKVEPRSAPLLDPFALAKRAEQLEPRAWINGVDLQVKPDETFTIGLEARLDPTTGEPYELGYAAVVLDPYDGKKLGTRRFKASLTREGLVSLIFELHYSLLYGETGGYIVGVAALMWTVDCFFGLYLTLPPLRRKQDPERHLATRRSWWRRWSISWRIKRIRLNYDLHRAGGLWTWAMLLVLAWSGVAFNLGDQVYRPVTAFALGMDDPPKRLPRAKPEAPSLDLSHAYAVGQRLLAEAATHDAFTIVHENGLYLDRATGTYYLTATSSLDHGARGGATQLIFDAESGRFVQLVSPATEPAGDTVTRWIVWLHTAAVGGVVMQLVISVTGIAIVGLSITGVIIWFRKWRIRRRKRQRLKHAVAARETAEGPRE